MTIRNTAFWTQQGSCTYALTASVNTLAQDLCKIKPDNPSMEEDDHNIPPLVEELLATDKC